MQTACTNVQKCTMLPSAPLAELPVAPPVPRRLCVVAGPAKLAALRGAIAAVLVTDLVIDEPTALMLVS